MATTQKNSQQRSPAQPQKRASKTRAEDDNLLVKDNDTVFGSRNCMLVLLLLICILTNHDQ
jgi:hypothetical protein